jgi:hypothetical protein
MMPDWPLDSSIDDDSPWSDTGEDESGEGFEEDDES